ncbi:MAG: insulinase family protein [SAR324 cluster bacterium]|nr:insulinase family protein [SAR324 cluster bacterium]
MRKFLREKQRRQGWWAVAALAGLSFALLAAGCEPRSVERKSVARLLSPAGEEIQYRPLVLPNQLKVMLVYDPRADRSAAAMSVGVGSLDDPPGRPGMAHFLEHMLFLGTKKYPQPGSYQKYLSSHGGGSNAYTADDHTNYFFSVSHEGFEEALDRFAHFFREPLFSEDYAEREVKAVDSEHSKNLESDYWRVLQVQRGAYDPAHPINRFSTGTQETLKGVGNAELRAYYRAQYSSNRMALAVVGNRGLDQLERMVKARFEQVPNRKLPRHRYPERYLQRKQALRILTVEPIADQRALVMEFPLPPTRQLYRSKPLHVLGHVLGHEGAGSLLSVLKKENLAASFSAGAGRSTADYSSFDLRISLTPEGLRRYREVLARVLGAIAGLRASGIPRYIFEEMRTMGEINYRYRPQVGASSQARSLAAQMRVYPLSELPKAARVVSEFDPQSLQKLLDAMIPENMLVTLIAKDQETDEVEPIYGSKYSYREFRGIVFQRLLAAHPDARWHLPAPNAYIPKRVALQSPSGPLKLSGTAFHQLRKNGLPRQLLAKLEKWRGTTFTGAGALLQMLKDELTDEERSRFSARILKDSLGLPVRLLQSDQAKIWVLPDWRFRQPKASIILKFNTERGYRNPREAMLAQLYESAIEEALNEFGYPIKIAGLSYSIEVVKAGVKLSFGGYSANMLALLEDIVGRLKRVSIDEDTFASLKERARRGIQNAKFAQPYRQARYYRKQLLVVPNFNRDALERELAGISLADVQEFAGALYKRIYVEGLVLGNLAPEIARASIRRAISSLGAKVLPKEKRLENEVRVLPQGSDYVFSERLRINNSFAGWYYQIGATNPRLRGAVLMISRPLREKFYFNMRTQQQLGYIVYAGMGQIKKTLSFNFLVQSGAYPAGELFQRMEAYIPKFVREYGQMPDEAFENYRRAVIEAKLRRSKNLMAAAGNLFWIAFENEEKFDHVSEDIRAVEALSRAEVEEILQNFLIGHGKRRLAIRLLRKEHPQGRSKGRPIQLPPETRAKAG